MNFTFMIIFILIIMILLCNYIKSINNNILALCLFSIVLFNEIYNYYETEKFSVIDKSTPGYEIPIESNINCHIVQNKCLNKRQDRLLKEEIYNNEQNWKQDDIVKTEYGKDIICDGITDRYHCNNHTQKDEKICKFNQRNSKCYNKNNKCIFEATDSEDEGLQNDKVDCPSVCHIIDNKEGCNKEIEYGNQKCNIEDNLIPNQCSCRKRGCIYKKPGTTTKEIYTIVEDNDPDSKKKCNKKYSIDKKISTTKKDKGSCISYEQHAKNVNDEIKRAYKNYIKKSSESTGSGPTSNTTGGVSTSSATGGVSTSSTTLIDFLPPMMYKKKCLYGDDENKIPNEPKLQFKLYLNIDTNSKKIGYIMTEELINQKKISKYIKNQTLGNLLKYFDNCVNCDKKCNNSTNKAIDDLLYDVRCVGFKPFSNITTQPTKKVSEKFSEKNYMEILNTYGDIYLFNGKRTELIKSKLLNDTPEDAMLPLRNGANNKITNEEFEKCNTFDKDLRNVVKQIDHAGRQTFSIAKRKGFYEEKTIAEGRCGDADYCTLVSNKDNNTMCKLDCKQMEGDLFESSGATKNDIVGIIYIFDLIPRCIQNEKKCQWIVPPDNYNKCTKDNLDLNSDNTNSLLRKDCINSKHCKWTVDKTHPKGICKEKGMCYDRCINHNEQTCMGKRKIKCNDQKIGGDNICVFDKHKFCKIGCEYADNQDELSFNVRNGEDCTLTTKPSVGYLENSCNWEYVTTSSSG